MIDSILILPFITAALYYLGARAMITSFLWRRYPPKLDYFLSCAACSGFWYGLGGAAVGWRFGVPFFGSTSAWAIPVAGLMSVVWTPILAAAHERAIVELTPPAPVDD